MPNLWMIRAVDNVRFFFFGDFTKTDTSKSLADDQEQKTVFHLKQYYKLARNTIY